MDFIEIEETIKEFGVSQESKDFSIILQEVQEHIIEKKLKIYTKQNKNDLKNYIKIHVDNKGYRAKDLKRDELIEKLYNELCEFSFLTDLLNRKDVEEININSWNDIKINYQNGEIVNSKEHFNSPSHALSVLRRLLHHSKMILDSSKPITRGHLSNNIRITAFAPPVIDENIGVCASIRIINPMNFEKEDFIRNGTANKAMLTFLEEALNSGISMCAAGSTGSGKTTLMSYLLKSCAPQKRIVTIENEVREFNLSDKKYAGVLHLVTKKNEEEKREITQEKLLEYALTANPDIICIAESKSSEAFSAQEAARTGHGVITTVHANSCSEVYYRLMTLCKMKNGIAENMLLKLIKEAFPITFYTKKFSDGKRRITEIAESDYKSENVRTLFKWNKNSFKKISEPSLDLQKRIKNEI